MSTIVAGGGAAGLNIVADRPRARLRARAASRARRRRSAPAARQYSDVVSEFATSRHTETHRLRLRRRQRHARRDRRGSCDASRPRCAGRWGRAATRATSSRRATPTRCGSSTSARRRRASTAEDDVKRSSRSFHDVHERVFAVREPGQYVECLTGRCRATAESPSRRWPGAPRGRSWRGRRRPSTPSRRLPRDRASMRVPRYDGATLPPGGELEGPALIHRADDHRRRTPAATRTSPTPATTIDHV